MIGHHFGGLQDQVILAFQLEVTLIKAALKERLRKQRFKELPKIATVRILYGVVESQVVNLSNDYSNMSCNLPGLSQLCRKPRVRESKVL
jgi:hypothetical protein